MVLMFWCCLDIYIYRQARDDMSMSNAKYATYCCGMSLDIVA